MGSKVFKKEGYRAHIIGQKDGTCRIEVPISAWILVGESSEEDVACEAEKMLDFTVTRLGPAPEKSIRKCCAGKLSLPDWFSKEFGDL